MPGHKVVRSETYDDNIKVLDSAARKLVIKRQDLTPAEIADVIRAVEFLTEGIPLSEPQAKEVEKLARMIMEYTIDDGLRNKLLEKFTPTDLTVVPIKTAKLDLSAMEDAVIIREKYGVRITFGRDISSLGETAGYSEDPRKALDNLVLSRFGTAIGNPELAREHGDAAWAGLEDGVTLDSQNPEDAETISVLRESGGYTRDPKYDIRSPLFKDIRREAEREAGRTLSGSEIEAKIDEFKDKVKNGDIAGARKMLGEDSELGKKISEISSKTVIREPSGMTWYIPLEFTVMVEDDGSIQALEEWADVQTSGIDKNLGFVAYALGAYMSTVFKSRMVSETELESGNRSTSRETENLFVRPGLVGKAAVGGTKYAFLITGKVDSERQTFVVAPLVKTAARGTNSPQLGHPAITFESASVSRGLGEQVGLAGVFRGTFVPKTGERKVGVSLEAVPMASFVDGNFTSGGELSLPMPVDVNEDGSVEILVQPKAGATAENFTRLFQSWFGGRFAITGKDKKTDRPKLEAGVNIKYYPTSTSLVGVDAPVQPLQVKGTREKGRVLVTGLDLTVHY